MFDFTDRVVAVTGASGIGIGRVIAERFFRAGAKLAICSRSEERILQSACEIAGQDDGHMLAMAADTSRREEVWRFVDRTVERFGRIDVLVNNAGVQFPKPSLEVTEEDWQRTVDTNLKGYFFASPARGEVHDGRRRDHQHRLGQRRHGGSGTGRLCRNQGGNLSDDEEPGARVGAAGNPGATASAPGAFRR